jgi:hypothetical protein
MAIGRAAVELADAVLAAMEKKTLVLDAKEPTEPEAPDAGPSDLAAIRRDMQAHLDSRLSYFERYPTTAPDILAHRDGVKDACANMLNVIDAAMVAEAEEEIIEIGEGGTVRAIGKTPDTEPPAEEIAPLADDALSRLRAEIQAQLDADLKADGASPTTNVRLSGFLEGHSDARKLILAMIDAAMGKAREVENA